MEEIILAVGPFALALFILIVMHFLGVPLFPRSLFGKKVRRVPHYSEEAYLFSWGNVPGSDSRRLLRFLRDDLDITWVKKAEIRKSDDGTTIQISKDENSVEIVIDVTKEKATLKIRDGRTYDLKAKKENDKLNIYKRGNQVGEWRKKLINKLGVKDKMRIICGECRDYERIEYALSRGLSVEVIMGQKIWNKASKEGIVRLMEKYPEKLCIFMLPERPERHASLFGHHFLLEDPHKYNMSYETAIAVEHASKGLKSHFTMQFEKMKLKGKAATVTDIQGMEFWEN